MSLHTSSLLIVARIWDDEYDRMLNRIKKAKGTLVFIEHIPMTIS